MLVVLESLEWQESEAAGMTCSFGDRILLSFKEIRKPEGGVCVEEMLGLG